MNETRGVRTPSAWFNRSVDQSTLHCHLSRYWDHYVFFFNLNVIVYYQHGCTKDVGRCSGGVGVTSAVGAWEEDAAWSRGAGRILYARRTASTASALLSDWWESAGTGHQLWTKVRNSYFLRTSKSSVKINFYVLLGVNTYISLNLEFYRGCWTYITCSCYVINVKPTFISVF